MWGRRLLVEDAVGGVGWESELRERDAGVEDLAVFGDQAILHPEAADAPDQHRLPLATRHFRGEAEAEPGIAERAVGDRFLKLPAVILAGVVKALQHRGDLGAAAMQAEEIV